MVDYEIIAPMMERLEDQLFEAHLSQDFMMEMNVQAEMLELLSCYGWNEKAFNAEMLKRIDKGWDISVTSPRGTHPMVLVALDRVAGIPPWKIQTSFILQ